MLQDFLTFVNTHHLFQPSERILLAISGGMDSVVMAELFHLAKFEFAIAHCNFGLRGEESDDDELFVKKLAKKYKVPFYVEHFDTQSFAYAEGLSIQMAARLLRYQWFETLLHQGNFAYVATAHQQNDALETVLLNLTKGTGIAGLHGIAVKRGRVIRPMGFAHKEMIYDFLVERQLVWREDSSNESSKYQRNLIRNEVIPLLKQINPNLEATFGPTIEKLAAVERVFQESVAQLRAEALRTEIDVHYLNFERIQRTAEPLILLYELVRPYHFTYIQAKEILDSMDKAAGKSFISPTHTLVKDRTEWIITPKSLANFVSTTVEEGQTEVDNGEVCLKITPYERSAFVLSPKPSVAWLDADTLRFPLKLRKWKEGDWFCPLGMNGKKKISDFLIDEKVPLNLKNRVWVLTSAGSVIWIVGQRIDNRFKITDKTERILKIELGKA